MIDKRDPLPWVEAQDQTCKGTKENENGAPAAELSSSTTQNSQKNSTIASRNHAVICPRPGIKDGKFNTHFHNNDTTKLTVFDKIR
jgi:hypothetical protein